MLDELKFKIYRKTRVGYELIVVKPETNDNWKFFANIKATVEKEIENIRDDMYDFFEDRVACFLTKPKSKDPEIQKKLNILVHFRKINSESLNMLKKLLEQEEFIICTCGDKMYKKPCNVSFIKVGLKYLIKDEDNSERIQYIFSCRRCNKFVSEQNHFYIMRHRALREKLLKEGEKWVPNELGFWHWVK